MEKVNVMTLNSSFSRRQFIKSTGLAVATTCLSSPLSCASEPAERQLKLYNTHTGEWFKDVYSIKGKLLPESVKQLNHLLRDWRSNEQISIDPRLFDLLHETQKNFGTAMPCEIISAYRCPKTNSMLRAQGNRVAKNSFHLNGQAIDFYIPKARLIDVRNFLYTQNAKGVGYYPSAGFVHIDVGHRPHLKNKQGRW